jgi:hypothetical protein
MLHFVLFLKACRMPRCTGGDEGSEHRDPPRLRVRNQSKSKSLPAWRAAQLICPNAACNWLILPSGSSPLRHQTQQPLQWQQAPRKWTPGS